MTDSGSRQFSDDYESALANHLTGSAGEIALIRAYELGRQAVAAGMGVLELVDVHQQSADAVLSVVEWRGRTRDLVKLTGEFLQEALSAYEVTHQGFREATEAALRTLQFEAAVCHELKTPLTSIVASAGMLRELMEAKSFDNLISPEAKLLANILDASDKLRTRTDDLMDIVGFRTGSLSLHMGRVAVGSLVQSVCESMDPAVTRAGLRLDVEVAEKLPPIVGDRDRLAQVLSNLIDNAIKYGGDGESIQVRAAYADDAVTLEVHDSGQGITLRDQARLFESSFRGKGAKKGVPGLGIGLALCSTIVDAHGGVISVESGVGLGSTFRVVLPAKAPLKKQKAVKGSAE